MRSVAWGGLPQQGGRGGCPDLLHCPPPKGAANPAEVTSGTPGQGPREPCRLQSPSAGNFMHLLDSHVVPVHPHPGY